MGHVSEKDWKRFARLGLTSLDVARNMMAKSKYTWSIDRYETLLAPVETALKYLNELPEGKRVRSGILLQSALDTLEKAGSINTALFTLLYEDAGQHADRLAGQQAALDAMEEEKHKLNNSLSNIIGNMTHLHNEIKTQLPRRRPGEAMAI